MFLFRRVFLIFLYKKKKKNRNTKKNNKKIVPLYIHSICMYNYLIKSKI